jgi:hypothetical protein
VLQVLANPAQQKGLALHALRVYMNPSASQEVGCDGWFLARCPEWVAVVDDEPRFRYDSDDFPRAGHWRLQRNL